MAVQQEDETVCLAETARALPAHLLRLQQVRYQLAGVVGAVVAQKLQLGVVPLLEGFSCRMRIAKPCAALQLAALPGHAPQRAAPHLACTASSGQRGWLR